MRILGITIPDEKKMPYALQVLFGVGHTRALEILTSAGVSTVKKPKELTPEEENSVRKAVEAFKIEGDLKREVSSNVKRLKDIKCYRGVRHVRSLPVHGQRTKSNSRTRRGNARKTMGTGRRAVDKK